MRQAADLGTIEQCLNVLGFNRSALLDTVVEAVRNKRHARIGAFMAGLCTRDRIAFGHVVSPVSRHPLPVLLLELGPVEHLGLMMCCLITPARLGGGCRLGVAVDAQEPGVDRHDYGREGHEHRSHRR